MSSLQRSGKTAPRLVQDVQDYDPAHPPGTGRNLLSDVPPVYPEHYNGPQDFISSLACRHQYARKEMQTFLSQPDQRRNTGTPSRVSAMCTKCRTHLQVVVNYAGAIGQSGQNLSGHIHHFVYKSGRQRGGASPVEVTPKGQVAESFHYECSYLSCSAAASIRVLSPVLADDRVRLLTDVDLLAERTDAAIAAYPERMEGIARPPPINVLANLRIYITNAIRDVQHSMSISAVNKRFMACFGVEGRPCGELLEFLGFTFKEAEGLWDPPRPNPWAEYPYQDQQKIFLDDIAHELAALMEQRPPLERRGNKIDPIGPSASDDLLDALEALAYPKTSRSSEFPMAPAPYYEDLGAVENMSSTLVVDAFNRQVSVDPGRTSLYLQCLKAIGELRGGEDGAIIDQAVQVAYAEGKYTDDDIVTAYRYFGLSHDDTRLTEDSIIGKFYAFLSSTNQETESRTQLWRIGDSRQSERIKSAAEDKVSNAEQAQVFLGVDDKTADDFIITMYTAKVNDNPATRDLARRAVDLIAQSRKSEGLKHFLQTGEAGAGEMDVADAYRLLQIPDRTIDDGAIMAAYTICIDEAPAQAETYNRALCLIAQDKNSSLLSSMVPGAAVQPGRNISEWPVGLQNIGNTCYLNSLLQFYFSVLPFREMVLDFESFCMKMDDEGIDKKQVGSRKIQKQEVERSQKFLRELRILFNDMINSSNPYVIPGQELARLTLIGPSNEAAIRRRSTISAGRPSGLGEISGMPILGPLGPPQTTTEESEKRGPSENPAIAEAERPQRPISDGGSEATLVSETTKQDTPAVPADDQQNASQQTDVVMTDPSSDNAPEATYDDDSHPFEPATAPIAQPSQPPPVPPRPTPQVDPRKQLIEEVEIGAQQDVTEVINNVLFQSQCAIRPLGIAPDGEQVDQIKDLFYGRTKSYLSTTKNVRSREEWWCDIKVDVATGSRDIYAAIDGAFDVQKVNIDNSIAEQYGAISKLPPVLQVQVQRVQFDPVKKSSFKSTHHLDLKETIYLDRYMDTQHPEILKRREQSWEWKKSLRKLEARRAELLRKNESDGLDMPTLFSSTKDLLDDLNSMKEDPEAAQDALDINPQLASEFGQFSQITQTELSHIEKEIRDTQTMISNQFAEYRHLAYRLHAVFVHRGSVSFGHYWIYIYDFKKNIWRKYNDSEVTEIQDPSEIFQDRQEQNPPTPYFLVYVNDTMKDRLVNPVCREIVDRQSNVQSFPETDQDTAMQKAIMASQQPTEGDVNMDPPAYNETWAGSGGAPGTGADLLPSLAQEKRADGNEEKRWSNTQTNTNDPQ
ncbi:ubiquitin-specific protease UBP2 [Aspergillus ruber CBS 135680]|uniref:ubiquitinyl hydrolase 1 n=1 Tax=Aspergillus ruber (strain CBS 135680) TaxID=1388766 RepID=A0A017S4P0_ASPRC|nr:putative ubiquitin carboxyl-terminal hydrolase [Aspergillus ruber CBS 135680]EYE91140.1 putative ubiquitin carboxyl-terminal hydrolase [Aspergillus ruber CBS 135680]